MPRGSPTTHHTLEVFIVINTAGIQYSTVLKEKTNSKRAKTATMQKRVEQSHEVGEHRVSWAAAEVYGKQ